MYTCIYTVHSCEHLNDSDRKSYNTNNLHKQSSIVDSKKKIDISARIKN